MAEDVFEQWARENVAPTEDGPRVKKQQEPQKPDKALVEKVAIEMAQGNNGGEWNINYLETQRQVWRDRASKVIFMIRQHMESTNASREEVQYAADDSSETAEARGDIQNRQSG